MYISVQIYIYSIILLVGWVQITGGHPVPKLLWIQYIPAISCQPGFSKKLLIKLEHVPLFSDSGSMIHEDTP